MISSYKYWQNEIWSFQLIKISMACVWAAKKIEFELIHMKRPVGNENLINIILP